MVSRIAGTGGGNATPCQASMIRGPLEPSPSSNLPPESRCNDIACIASIAGVRAPTCTMPETSPMRSVRAARKASGVSAS